MALATIVLVAAALVWLFQGRSDAPADDPEQRAVAEEPPPTPPAPPDPGGTESSPRPPRETPPPKLGTPLDLGELTRQVADIRKLPLQRKLSSRALSSRALADKISQLAFAELDEDEVEADERLLVALRLAQPDFDLAQTLEGLYREQVLGVYVPEERTLYVRREGRESPAQKMTTAHEITHALQDRSFDIKRLQERYKDDADASLAVLSLIEGDAVLTQQLWAQEHLSSDELNQAVEDSATGGDALANAPDYLRESLFFPYAEGGLFVAALYREGGYAAIDRAFTDPPTTSEQILHPERYQQRDEATAVKVRTRPGSGWKRSATYEFGEFDLREMLKPIGSETATAAAKGWDGGEVRSWVKGAQTAVAAVLVFDAQADADEACAAVQNWYSTVADGVVTDTGAMRGDRDFLAFRCDGDAVHVGLAPTQKRARDLAAAP